MKKRFKRIMSVAVCGIMLASCMLVANAGGSGYKESPAMTAGVVAIGPAYACWSQYGTATGKNSYTYFRNYGTLQNNFEVNDNRYLEVQLKESDPYGDDLVKIYKGTFKGLKLNYIELKQTVESGNLELPGDNKAELYITSFVSKLGKDPRDPKIASGLFEYSVGIN